MIHARLNWDIGAGSGESGWIPAGQPNFDPSFSGGVVAHDLLEHMRATKGAQPITNEMQALGAMLWGRGQAGALNDCPGKVLADELEYHAVDVFCSIDKPPRPVPRLRDERMEEWIAQAVKRARKTVIRELDHNGWRAERRRDLRQSLDWLAAWLRTGVRRAIRRYPTLGPGQLVSLFNRVEQATEHLLKEEGYEGDYIAVRINPRDRTATARIVRRYD